MQEDVYQGDGLNLYAYCHNNPVVYYDPSGYVLSQADLNKILRDTKSTNNYAYYQNKTHRGALKTPLPIQLIMKEYHFNPIIFYKANGLTLI